jgi:hypothetical protein
MSQLSSSLPPVPLDQHLVLIDRYIRSTSIFLNSFSITCEERLKAVSAKIKRLETEILILESKFDQSKFEEIPKDPVVVQNGSENKSQVAEDEVSEEHDVAESSKQNILVEDQRLQKYQAMIRVGIPKEAVLLKMKSDGIALSGADIAHFS